MVNDYQPDEMLVCECCGTETACLYTVDGSENEDERLCWQCADAVASEVYPNPEDAYEAIRMVM
jgi:hypothetical protein